MKSFNALITIVLLIVNISQLFGQTLKTQDIIPTSPTAAELGKYGSTSVGLFTGTPQISIPLFELKTNNLSLPITLNYSSNGLIVDKIASWVGFDWSLDAGGVITRSVRGKYDRYDNRIPYPPEIETDEDSRRTFLMLHCGLETDLQPDIFTFNFPGYSGKFFLNDDGDSAILIPYQKLKIETTQTNLLYCYDFTITTPDGVKYIFDYQETFKCEYGCSELEQYPVSWFLTSIIHPTGETINFHYSVSQSEKFYSGVYQQVSRAISEGCSDGQPSSCPEQSVGYQLPTAKISSNTVVYLDSISTFSFGRIIFQKTGNRSDLKDGRRLSSIIIKNSKNDTLRTIYFDHTFVERNEDYEYSTRLNGSLYLGPDYSANLNYRMFLDTIRIHNSSDQKIQQYSFEYLNRTVLPSRLSFAQDYWGFFNGQLYNQDFVPPSFVPLLYASEFTGLVCNREPNWQYSRNGLLNKITYPTGGYSLLDYESHHAAIGDVGGCRIKTVSTYESAGSTPIIKKYFYSVGSSQGLPQYYTEYKNFISCTCYQCGCWQQECIYGSLTSNSLISLYLNEIYHVAYSVVTISHGNDYENGKERHSFTIQFDDPGDNINIPYGGIILPLQFSNTGWYTGKKVEEEILKKNDLGQFVDVKKTTYGYNRYDTCNKTDYYCLAMQHQREQSSCPPVGWDQLNKYDAVKYLIHSVWEQPTHITVTDYFDGGNITTTTNYLFNNKYHAQLSTETFTDSKGNTITKKYYYPQDYSINCYNFDTLVYKNIINKPIDIRTYYNANITSCEQFKYNNYGQPIDFYKGEIDNTITDIPFSWSNPYTATHELSMKYYGNYNLKSSTPENNITTSYYWGYNNTLPIAKIENADSNEILIENFENGNYEGWEDFGSGGVIYSLENGDAGATGLNAVKFNYGEYRGICYYLPLSNIDLNGEYTISVKVKNISAVNPKPFIGFDVIYSGQSWWPAARPDTSSKWQYVKKSIDLSSVSGITAIIIYILNGVSGYSPGDYGEILVDDISFYPSDAQMSTYTYDPQLGITSETDPGGKTSYYEYDDFGRLQRIKDHNGYILKEFKYHYAN